MSPKLLIFFLDFCSSVSFSDFIIFDRIWFLFSFYFLAEHELCQKNIFQQNMNFVKLLFVSRT